LAVTSYQIGDNSYPKLTWTQNNEPDVFIANNAYEIQRRTRQVPGSWGNWSTIGYRDGSDDFYVDNEIIIEGTGSIYQAEYRIRAIDEGNHYSPFSSVVSIYFGQFNPHKVNTGVQVYVYDYQLLQSYPNPFNPSTTISYSLAQDADVTLRVYDILGTQVAELVNEPQDAGSYSVNFKADNLSSGVYIYRIVASKNGRILFTDVKQMILLR